MRTRPEASGQSMHSVISVKPQPLPPQALNIAECSLATDSVVATVTVRLDAPMRRIVVQWGDGAVNTLRKTPEVEAAVGHPDPLPAGTYRLSHAYAPSEDRKPFHRFVLIRAEDASGGIDYCVRKITLTPRYRVTNYRTTLTLVSECDSIFEKQSEFLITLSVGGEIVGYWEWKPYESSVFGSVVLDEQSFVLEGSIVSRELTVADGSVPVRLEIVEGDPVFDETLSIDHDLSATLDSERVEFTRLASDYECELRFRYDREVTLIVPMPSYGQEVVVKG
jgi:hypothetical protein